MKEPTYSAALSHSWSFVWKHKSLWLFGFFAALLGQMGVLDLMIKVGMSGTGSAFFPAWLVLPEFFQSGLFSGSLNLPLADYMWLMWVFAVIISAILFLLFAAVASQGALVHSTAQALRRGKGTPSFDKAWHAGVDHFWRVFAINIMKKIIILFLGLTMAYATINALLDPGVLDALLFIGLFILAMIVGMVVSLVSVYAVGYVVVEEYGVLDALAHGWRLFVAHWLVSLEVGVVILFFNLLLGAIVIAGLFVIYVPMLVAWVLVLSLFGSLFVPLAWTISIAFFTLLIIFLGSLFSAFTTATWTHLFMKMHTHGIKSRLLTWSGFHR